MLQLTDLSLLHFCSRSQCIINIRSANNSLGEQDYSSDAAVLTIVDLAGAEKERKTGNQVYILFHVAKGTGKYQFNFSLFKYHMLKYLTYHAKSISNSMHLNFDDTNHRWSWEWCCRICRGIVRFGGSNGRIKWEIPVIGRKFYTTPSH